MELDKERQNVLEYRYRQVMDNIRIASERCGGRPVKLLAASKTRPAEEIVWLMNHMGLQAAGENRQDEFSEKYSAVAPCGEYHFIGHLQTNKVKYLIGRATLIHSVDSLHLAEEIGRQSVARQVTTSILCQLNSGGESAKSGFDASEIRERMSQIAEIPGIKLCGMMVVSPRCDEKSEIRKYFQKSYAIFIDFFAKTTHNIEDPILSMGMSDSYVEAIEEGASLVRVGSALFGERNYACAQNLR